jgi:anti-sigma B factor antagonist
VQPGRPVGFTRRTGFDDLEVSQALAPAGTTGQAPHERFQIHHLHRISLSADTDGLPTALAGAWFNTFQASRSVGVGDRVGPWLGGEIVDLSLNTREVDSRTIVAVGGEIDVYTAPKLRDKITELVGEGHHQLVIDMENVDFLDSTGLGVLVGGLKKVRAHEGSMELICSQDRLLKIFRITGLAKVFTIHESESAALGA